MTKLNDSHDVFKDIRLLRLLVIHPDDGDREELTAQLSRIGCSFTCTWPSLEELPQGTDMVLMSVHPDTLSQPCHWLDRPNVPPIIPIVAFENPITLAAVLHLNAFTTIASPVRPVGVLTALALTLHQCKKRRSREHYIQRLEQKAAHQQIIGKATRALMDARRLKEDEAYEVLRERAMLQREPIESVARQILRATEALGM
jgi:AmiR/NasT family two-component response regulator